MKIKTQLTLASVIAAGLLASGCSSQQLIAQPSAPAVVDTVVNTVSVPAPVTTVTETMTNTVVDCSKCNRPAPRPRPQPRPQNNNMHSHPAVHGCSAAVQHAHPRPRGGQHNHRYGCNKQQVRRPAPRPVQRPAPRANPNAHTHPAIPNCTKSVRHVHPNGNRGHSHRYSCQRPRQVQRPVQRPVYRPQPVQRPVYRPQPVQRPVYRPQPVQQPMPVMPKVKAKGTYRGPIKIDGMMQQYQQ